MKKILFIVNVDWFFISHRLPLAIEALKKGYEVHIACGITDKKEYLENLGLKVHPLNISRSSMGIKAEIKAFIEIYKILKEINPDIAHFVTIKPMLYGGITSRFLKIRIPVPAGIFLPTITFSFKPDKVSFLAAIAAVLNTLVVSWNDAAEIQLSTPNDALVIP